MTAQAHEAPEAQVAENIATTLHRAHMRQRQLAVAVGVSQPTLSRRMLGAQPWLLWEVQTIADYFGLTLTEITTDLPTRDEWQVRWDELCACRDSNPKPSDLVLIVNRGLTPDRLAGRGRATLRAVA